MGHLYHLSGMWFGATWRTGTEKDMCLLEIGLCVQNMIDYYRFNSQHCLLVFLFNGGGGTYITI